LSRSLSDCSEDVVVVRRLSLVSRSRTCRSLRSRKALCLSGNMSAQNVRGKGSHIQLTLLCSVLSALTAQGSRALYPRYLISCPAQRVRRPSREQCHPQKIHWEVVKDVVRWEMTSWSCLLIRMRCRSPQPMCRSCTRKQMEHIRWRQMMFPCSTLCRGSAMVLLRFRLCVCETAKLTSTAPLPSLAPWPRTLASLPKPKYPNV
jgi:hypothetical protein